MLGNLIFQNDECDSIKQSFQDGCNAIYNACIDNGIAPDSNSPEDIVDAINKIATTNRSPVQYSSANAVLTHWHTFTVYTASPSTTFSKSATDDMIVFSGSKNKGSGVSWLYGIFPYLIDFSQINSITQGLLSHSTKFDGQYGQGDVTPFYITIFNENTIIDDLINNQMSSGNQNNPPESQIYADNLLLSQIIFQKESTDLNTPEDITTDLSDINEKGYLGYCYKIQAGNGYGNNSFTRVYSIRFN